MVKTEVFLQVFVPKEYMTKPRDLPSLLHVSQAWGRGLLYQHKPSMKKHSMCRERSLKLRQPFTWYPTTAGPIPEGESPVGSPHVSFVPTTITYGADCTVAFRTQACLASVVPHATFAQTTGIRGMQCTASFGETCATTEAAARYPATRGCPGLARPFPPSPQDTPDSGLAGLHCGKLPCVHNIITVKRAWRNILKVGTG